MDSSDNSSSDNSTTPKVQKAGPPFDDPEADVIIRSSDNVDFHVFKFFLTYSSTVFKDMFHLALGEPEKEELKDNLQIIPTEESAETWRILLRLSYPVSRTDAHTVLNTLDEVLLTLGPSRKYGMEKAEQWIRENLVAPRFIEKEPMRVFVIACHWGWENEAKSAARQTLTRPMLGDGYMPELEKITAGDYHRLLEYHQQCGKVASDVAHDMSWIDYHYVWFSLSHQVRCKGSQTCRGRNFEASKWWLEYMQAAAGVLKDRPSSTTINANSELMKSALKAANLCPTCSLKAGADMKSFGDKFAARIDDAVSSVLLNIKFVKN